MIIRDITQRRPGVTTVFVAFSLVTIIGLVALSVDGGLLHLKSREARAHADAAAMAGACDLYSNYPKYAGVDTNGTASAQAKAVASANGATNDGTTSKVTVNIPPASGPYKDKAGYVEVLVTYYVDRAFSRIFDSTPLPVSARAVAYGAWSSPKAGIIILDYDDRASLNAQGNGAFTETGAPVIVNSNNPSATVTAGNGNLIGQEFYITGGMSVSGNSSFQTQPVAGQIFTGSHPTPDPLAYLPVPSTTADGEMTRTSLGQGNHQYVLTPGRYTNLPNFTTGDVVILQQASANDQGGIFYIDGGGFRSTGATIKMGDGTGGVMIYNNPRDSNSDKLQITGNPDGQVNLSGLTSGPYAGMSIWQNRNSNVDMLIEGNGDFNIKGTLYAAGARLNINGNGKTSAGDMTGFYYDDNGNKVNGASQVGSTLIVNNLSLGGNGNIRINYNAPATAKTRIITLVE